MNWVNSIDCHALGLISQLGRRSSKYACHLPHTSKCLHHYTKLTPQLYPNNSCFSQVLLLVPRPSVTHNCSTCRSWSDQLLSGSLPSQPSSWSSGIFIRRGRKTVRARESDVSGKPVFSWCNRTIPHMNSQQVCQLHKICTWWSQPKSEHRLGEFHK